MNIPVEIFENTEKADSQALALDASERIVKSIILIACFVAIYAFLIFSKAPWYLNATLTVILSLLSYSIILCIGHDAVHGSFSRNKRLNEVALLSLDFFGVNGKIWRKRHMTHHYATNSIELDPDIQSMPWLRLSRYHKKLPHHRVQALAVIFIYVLIIIKSQIFDEIQSIFEARPDRRFTLIIRSFLGKLFFVTWAFFVPISMHGHIALPFIMIGYFIFSLTISLLFMVGHNVIGVKHQKHRGLRPSHQEWQKSQIEATANFEAGKLLSYFLGGLNRQIEHHLFPQLPHTQIESRTGYCIDISNSMGIEFKSYRSLLTAIISHFKYLHALGRDDFHPNN